MADDNVQHGIDDNPHGDAGKGAGLGAVGGAVVGLLAGGPVGAVVGAVAGGLASGAAVAAVDTVDNDNTVSGVGDGATGDANRMGTGTNMAMNTSGSNLPDIETVGGTTGSNLPDIETVGGTTGSYATTDVRATDVAATTNTTDAGVMRVPVMEEQINVEKGMHQAGEVQVTKNIVEEQVNVPVTLQHEEAVVTRHAVDRDLAPGEQATMIEGNETIRVPLMEETVSVTKSAHVAEEIEIQKQKVAEQQTVSDTVRREEVNISQPTTGTHTETTTTRTDGIV